MPYKQLIIDFIKANKFEQKSLAKAKRDWCRQNNRPQPKNSVILKEYLALVKTNPSLQSPALANLLHLKKIRTISGVAPVAILTKPWPCPGQCVYCPTQTNIPKSYLDDEPAVMRAVNAGFDPYIQIQRRLKQYLDIGHTPEKIELIVIGGSFSSLSEKYKYWYITRCFDACNQYGEKQENTDKRPGDALKKLLTAQKINEKARYRITGLTLETRPDLITAEETKLMRRLGCTRVELGVQTVYPEIFKKIRRGHGLKEVIKATRLLKNAGFKICYHLMPNLPGSSLIKDFNLFKTVYTDSRFKPDMVKIYPCVVIKNTKLYDWFKAGQYHSYTDSKLIKLLVKAKQITPRWVRINRLYRDIPAGNIVSGSTMSNMRQHLQTMIKKENKKCRCIRCREVKSINFMVKNLRLKTTRYEASRGVEYFLEYVDFNDRVYALLRLRLPLNDKVLYKILKKAAIVRELHTYGQALAIKAKNSQKTQHRGLGKKLLIQAEKIARKNGYKKIAVIAGVGAREYYQKLGYTLEDTYMVKKLAF